MKEADNNCPFVNCLYRPMCEQSDERLCKTRTIGKDIADPEIKMEPVDIKEIHEHYCSKLKVNCCEYHVHRISQDCFEGSEEDKLIVRLTSHIMRLETKLQSILSETKDL